MCAHGDKANLWDEWRMQPAREYRSIMRTFTPLNTTGRVPDNLDVENIETFRWGLR